jgi:hypothetical protein
MSIEDGEKDRFAVDGDILVRAFEDALKELALNRTHPKALVVAQHIITFAKAGERDPVRLRDLTLEAYYGRGGD